ncbi:MAG: acyl-CoA/acyl-ACP dehydrogenase [Proteobacteria bacterium]|nr:acyl-CoA/acyl-ACP dehydrogenase [Pseudomonadota bacterium]
MQSSTGSIMLDDVDVSDEDIVGGLGEGSHLARKTFSPKPLLPDIRDILE